MQNKQKKEISNKQHFFTCTTVFICNNYNQIIVINEKQLHVKFKVHLKVHSI